MSENQKFCVRTRSAKNAGKPYVAKLGGLFLIPIQLLRRAFQKKNTDPEPGFCKKTFIFNQGMDACCGLYDEYYWFYTVPGYVEE